MSSRITRALLRLYPRRVRDRYGEELLDLEDELRARGEFSRRDRVRDMLAGAYLTWPVRWRQAASATGAAAVVAGLTIGASVTIGHRATPPGRAPQSVPRLTAQRVTSATVGACPIAARSACSTAPCVEFVDGHTRRSAAPPITVPTVPPPRRLGSRCPGPPSAQSRVATVTAPDAPMPR